MENTFTVIMIMYFNLGQYGIHLNNKCVCVCVYTNYVEYGTYLQSNYELVH